MRAGEIYKNIDIYFGKLTDNCLKIVLLLGRGWWCF
jgi:hypothetical protein